VNRDGVNQETRAGGIDGTRAMPRRKKAPVEGCPGEQRSQPTG